MLTCVSLPWAMAGRVGEGRPGERFAVWHSTSPERCGGPASGRYPYDAFGCAAAFVDGQGVCGDVDEAVRGATGAGRSRTDPFKAIPDLPNAGRAGHELDVLIAEIEPGELR
jgi:hypothetical protein